MRFIALTPKARVDRYNRLFPDFPPLHWDGRWIEGVWILGNDYQNTTSYYGTYPPQYLKRMQTLFPEPIFHIFGGAVTTGITIDINPKLYPTIIGDAHKLPIRTSSLELVMADPPYSKDDALKYGTAMPNRKKVMHEIARVVKPNGNLIWLDTVLPMFTKREWHWYGVIPIIRSTNHRVRLASIFRRVENGA